MNEKYYLHSDIEEIVNNYKPYRSIASLILWASVESDTFFKKSIS